MDQVRTREGEPGWAWRPFIRLWRRRVERSTSSQWRVTVRRSASRCLWPI